MANYKGGPGGAPTKLTAAIQSRIVSAILAGNYLCVAAKFAGIPAETLSRWLTRGEQKPNSVYGKFHQAVKDAEAQAEVRVVAKLNQHMEESWQACMTYLERKHPDRWGRKSKVEVTQKPPEPPPAQIDLSKLSNQELALLDKLSREYGGQAIPTAGGENA